MRSSSTDRQLDFLGLSMVGPDNKTYEDARIRVVMEQVGQVAFTDEQFARIVEAISTFVSWRATQPLARSGEEFQFFSSEFKRITNCASKLKSLITIPKDDGSDANYKPEPLRAGLIETISLHGFNHDRLGQLSKLLRDLIELSQSLNEDLADSLTRQSGAPKKHSGNQTYLIAEIKRAWLEAGGCLPGPVGARHVGDGKYKGTLFKLVSTILNGHSEVLNGRISDLAANGIYRELQALRDF